MATITTKKGLEKGFFWFLPRIFWNDGMCYSGSNMVQSGFTRKKVESLTLGEKMKKLRNDFRTSLQEISKATRIQAKYLEYLENGEYDKLPADVYVRGFLRSYARYLNIDEHAFIKLYERERNIQENLGMDIQPIKRKVFSPASLVITSRSIVVGFIFLLVSGAFFYLYKEFKSFAAAPRLIILEPSNGETLSSSEVVVRGKTDKGSQVTINNQAVFVGNEGEFSDKLILQPGMNAVTINATNRFGKAESETLSLQADYAVTLPDPTSQMSAQETFRLELLSKESPLELVVNADGAEVFRGILAPHQSKNFEAKDKLAITSNHGENTFVRFNGKEEEALSSVGQRADGVVFTKAGRQN